MINTSKTFLKLRHYKYLTSEFYLSEDGENWGSPVVSGEFKNTTALQVASLKTPTKGRYFKFVAKSEINGNAWTSAAEIGIQIVSEATGIETVDATGIDASSPYIYDLNGQRMNSPFSALPKGIYIYKGKKYLKR